MPVDISAVLHVLAHELRTPTGIAQGYVRLLLEDRLPEPADQRRAIEQMQKALTRIGELSHESSALATLLDQASGDRPQATGSDQVPGIRPQATGIAAHTLVERVAADATLEPPLVVRSTVAPSAGSVRTSNADALVQALVTIAKVTARELREQPCTLSAGVSEPGTLEIIVGRDDQIPTLAQGPHAPGAGPITLERGGVGLSLIHADVVLEAHGAKRWTMADTRTTVGIQFHIEEGTP